MIHLISSDTRLNVAKESLQVLYVTKQHNHEA